MRLPLLTAQGADPDDASVACALGTSLNLWDICIGEMQVFGNKANFAKWLPTLGTSSEYLIVQQKVKEPTFGKHMASVFSPFSGELWAVLLAFCVVFGLAFALLERDGEDFEDSSGVLNKLATTMYKSSLSAVTGGPTYEPGTTGGKILMLGFGWLLLITAASYTANLASLLVVANSLKGISDIDGLIKIEGSKLCVPHEVQVGPYTELYPALRGRIIASGGIEMALKGLHEGKCQGAAGLDVGELEVLQSESWGCTLAVVGSPLSEVSKAYAVSLEYHERLSPLVASKLAENQLSQLFKDARPKSACPSRVAASSTMGPEELAGVFIPSAVLLMIGLSVGLLSVLRKKAPKTKQAPKTQAKEDAAAA